MKVVKAEKVDRQAAGNWYLAVIVSEEAPASMSPTGADVDGMSDDDRFAAGSVIVTAEGNYIAFEDGVFTLKSA